MDATDALLIVMRWLHLGAAVVWIGAVWFDLFVATPSLEGEYLETAQDRFNGGMREIVQTSLIVFLVSGAIMTFERLSHGAAGSLYVGLLALKIFLALVMFQIAFRFRRARGGRRLVGLRWLVGLGLVILLLAVMLKWVYERALFG
ncbi:MAG: hypothetical protein IT305_00125 [Chloroflexi bacterium]|nr:hypothetical protein [Chloroflexota bacterium]